MSQPSLTKQACAKKRGVFGEFPERFLARFPDVKRARLGWQEVQNIDLMHLRVADVDKGWDIAPQVGQRMKVEHALGATEVSSVEQAGRRSKRSSATYKTKIGRNRTVLALKGEAYLVGKIRTL